MARYTLAARIRNEKGKQAAKKLRRESRIPDYRNTLFWSPDVKTDADGRAAVEFYTSDEAGDYMVLVEGFTPDGHRGSATFLYSVK